ncbi:MAG: DUF2201 family putative metallopeptidase [Thermoguttaceae bacterium]
MSLLRTESYPLADRILDCFPSGTYALSALLRLLDVVETRDVETAAVECRLQPRLLINPDFVDAWAATPEKLLMLVMHELHHVLLGHTRLFPRLTRVDNLVFDAIINALLCRMFPAPEHTVFFTDFYDENHFPDCLLRPPSHWKPDGTVAVPPPLEKPAMRRLTEVYLALYSPKGASYDDIYDALRETVSELLAGGVVLLGDHGGGKLPGIGSADGYLDERSPILFEIVRQIVERWPQPPDPIAGRSLSDLLRNESVQPRTQRSNRAVLRNLFRRLVDVRGHNGILPILDENPREIMTPLPTPDRRSIVLGAIGRPPILHQGELTASRRVPAGSKVHVYVDVSGSIASLKGALYGAVLDCRQWIHPAIHLFSECVIDVSPAQLRQGVCSTTVGTSIGCVADHLRQHRVKRAVVLTDGYVGRPTGTDRETLCRVKLGVALTPGNSTRADLEEVTDFWAQLEEPRNK